MARETTTRLRDTVIATLGEDVLTLGELRSRLGAPWNRVVGRDDLDRLLQLDGSFAEVSAGFVFVPALLEGTAWTVRIDAGDAAEGFVRMHPDLSALGWWLIADDVELVDADGTSRGVLETDGWMLDGRDTDVVLGPEGWLDGLVGGRARVEVVGGALRWSPIDEPPAATAAQIEAMKAGFERAVRDDDFRRSFDAVPIPEGLRFASGEGPIHEALVVDRSAFRRDPIPPVDDLYRAAGLVERDGLIAAAGFNWDALHEWQTRNRFGISHGLDPQQADVLAHVLAVFDAGDATRDVAVLAALDDGDVAAAAWEELGRRGVPMEALAELAAAASAGEPSIGRTWLQARVLDRGGASTAAVELLEAAVDATCRHGPALIDLAGFRADRGDAAGALRLLVQAGVDPEPAEDADFGDRDDEDLLWEEVEGFATHRPRPTARRNDPCPCGSGRKYKACHLGRETHGLDDRAGWLYNKASRFLRDRRPLAVEELAELVVGETNQHDWFDVLIDGPFLRDVVLHEDGVFAEFLAARDGLLPDDEALLAAQWGLVDRGVFEVLATTGTELELRNIATGDRVRVVNTHPADGIRPGSLLLGRPLPVGETYRAFSGFMAVPNGHQDAMVAAIDSGDSEQIADALAAILAPPRLTNTDGQDLIAHTITWRLPKPDAVSTALVDAGLRADGDDHWTLVRDSKNQNNTVIASVRLDGDELTVEVNSAERAAELQLLVADALPDAEVIDLEAHPFEMPDEPVRTSGMRPAELDDPAIRAALAEHVADYERRWLDESIPALGGRTPREAAGDPIGREELTRLLASFPIPEPGDVGAMDPDRVRAALGL
jgi:hypothetical protein